MIDLRKVEKKWQKIWGKEGIYRVKDKVRGRKNFYHLVMFPYPSGDLHIGHWYNFAPADVYARFKRMAGFNVFSPIGFDAFGLPAENAAIKRKIHPKDWTYQNIKNMTRQLKSIGAVYDWSRSVITSDPEYYKWTQWLFLQFFKNGLVYRKKAAANWCPKCHTVLANEQVIDCKCERCDTQVVQREIEQWLFKITDYAGRLLNDLDSLDWPEKTKAMQRNWIGRSEGAEIEFRIKDLELRIKVFTTRLDTIFGCTYLSVAPEHKIIKNLEFRIKNLREVQKYIEQAKKKTELQRLEVDKQKTGVELKGIKAVNPFNNEEVPIFVADYALGHYGAGAVMAVPAHDQRDWEFAEKFNLSKKIVVCPNYPEPTCPILENAYEEDGRLVASGKFTGMSSGEAREKMADWLEKTQLGNRKVNYKLRDWLVSRQRYWGTPIPLIFCENCADKIKNKKSKLKNKQFSRGELENAGWVAVSEKDLPVKLPNIKDYLPTEKGESPLAKSKKFVGVKCPKCGSPAKRETDTMDTFVCSSWYYLRYVDSKNDKKFAGAPRIKNWLPVKMYVGGAEHSVLHLLYSRFFTKALNDSNYLNFNEPFSALRHQGTILGPDGQKMSKSRGNVVDPDELVEKFGSDCVRMYLCFMGPYDQGGPWNPGGILGTKRFLDKIYKFYRKSQISNPKSQINSVRQSVDKIRNSKLEHLFHKTIKKVGEDIENFRFNTAISALMILFNELEKQPSLKIENWKLFIKLLSPFAPHLAEDIWQQLHRLERTEHRLTQMKGKSMSSRYKSVFQESWPKYDARLIKEEKIELVIQVNGKTRDKFSASAGISQKEAEKIALEREKIKQIVGSKPVKKLIFVPDRLINIVIG